MSEHEHPFNQRDLAERKRALERDIGRKADTRPTTDANGTPTSAPVLYEYDSHGMLLGRVDTKPVA